MAKVLQYQSGMSNGFFVVDRGTICVDGGARLGGEFFEEACGGMKKGRYILRYTALH